MDWVELARSVVEVHQHVRVVRMGGRTIDARDLFVSSAIVARLLRGRHISRLIAS